MSPSFRLFDYFTCYIHQCTKRFVDVHSMSVSQSCLCSFYAIPILHFKFPIFYLLVDISQTADLFNYYRFTTVQMPYKKLAEVLPLIEMSCEHDHCSTVLTCNCIISETCMYDITVFTRERTGSQRVSMFTINVR